MSQWKVVRGDCLAVLKELPDNSFHSMCTDPPSGTGFMGRSWDSDKGGRDQWIAWLRDVMKEAMRCLKPGAHCLVWALPRTSHWTATALEDAGFEVRDCVTHHFGSGFPKSADISKTLDKMAGAERTEGAREWSGGQRKAGILGENLGTQTLIKYDTPATDEAKEWNGWGTALKPATEHWILCRKPLSESSIARNVLKWRTGALNIDACRVNRASDDVPGWHKTGAAGSKGYQGEDTFRIRDMSAEEIQERCGDKGRWPPNLLLTCSCNEPHDDPTCPVAEMDRQSGRTSTTGKRSKQSQEAEVAKTRWLTNNHRSREYPGDSGGASRFFPTFKQQRECELCLKPANAVDSSSNQQSEPEDSAHGPARLDPQQDGEDRNRKGDRLAANAERNSGHISLREGNSAQCSAWDSRSEQTAQHVRSVARLCRKCETTIVRVLVEAETARDRAECLGALSIEEHKKQILLRYLACFAETQVNVDTIPTIASLRLLFGCVRGVINGTIISESPEELKNGQVMWKYQAKPSSSERNAGLDDHPDRTLNRVNPGGIEADPRWAPVQVKNSHPTLKSISLMKWLCQLITPAGGYILDPFMGSGSTGCAAVQCGFGFYGIDQNEDYVQIAESRIRYWEAKTQVSEE